MTREPAGAVAIWHDIAPEGLAEFYAWHGEEHMPERAAIPGFLRGRRFVASEADRGFFNLYETETFSTLTGPGYKARLDAPTPRTLSAVRHFRNVARSLCKVDARFAGARTGLVQGGLLATLRYDVEHGREDEHRALVTGGVARDLAEAPGIAAVTLLAADPGASGYVNAEQRARGDANLIPPFAVLVEGWAEEEAFRDRLKSAFAPQALAALHVRPGASLGFYRHQVTVSR